MRGAQQGQEGPASDQSKLKLEAEGCCPPNCPASCLLGRPLQSTTLPTRAGTIGYYQGAYYPAHPPTHLLYHWLGSKVQVAQRVQLGAQRGKLGARSRPHLLVLRGRKAGEQKGPGGPIYILAQREWEQLAGPALECRREPIRKRALVHSRAVHRTQGGGAAAGGGSAQALLSLLGERPLRKHPQSPGGAAAQARPPGSDYSAVLPAAAPCRIFQNPAPAWPPAGTQHPAPSAPSAQHPARPAGAQHPAPTLSSETPVTAAWYSSA